MKKVGLLLYVILYVLILTSMASCSGEREEQRPIVRKIENAGMKHQDL